MHVAAAEEWVQMGGWSSPVDRSRRAVAGIDTSFQILDGAT